MLLVFVGINLYISGFQYIIAENYRETIIVVPIISMGYLLYGIYINHSIWYKLNDMTKFGAYITLIGAVITILINVLLIPVFGYMASAWAHIASYSTMIIMSFIFAEKHYRISYSILKLIPYFIIAIGMVIFSLYFKYPDLITELGINTVFILLFIAYAQYKDKMLTIFFGKESA
jgi:O-antigen/teichoic acid export membrane protein